MPLLVDVGLQVLGAAVTLVVGVYGVRWTYARQNHRQHLDRLKREAVEPLAREARRIALAVNTDTLESLFPYDQPEPDSPELEGLTFTSYGDVPHAFRTPDKDPLLEAAAEHWARICDWDDLRREYRRFYGIFSSEWLRYLTHCLDDAPRQEEWEETMTAGKMALSNWAYFSRRGASSEPPNHFQVVEQSDGFGVLLSHEPFLRSDYREVAQQVADHLNREADEQDWAEEVARVRAQLDDLTDRTMQFAEDLYRIAFGNEYVGQCSLCR